MKHKGREYSFLQTNPKEVDASTQQYGPWLRAQLMNSSLFEVRKYGEGRVSVHQQLPNSSNETKKREGNQGANFMAQIEEI